MCTLEIKLNGSMKTQIHTCADMAAARKIWQAMNEKGTVNAVSVVIKQNDKVVPGGRIL